MANIVIKNRLRKNRFPIDNNRYHVNNSWRENEKFESHLFSMVLAGINHKEAVIIEVPTSGYLTIDGQKLYVDQIIRLVDLARMEFKRNTETQNSDYGHFKIVTNKGSDTEQEYNYVIDANFINGQNTNNKDDNENENSFKLKNKKLEEELIDFITKRESGVVFDMADNCWVEATKSAFEEDIFGFDDTKSKIN